MQVLNKVTEKQSYSLAVIYLYYPDGSKYQKEKPIRALKKIVSRFHCKTLLVYVNNASKEGYSQRLSDNEYDISGDNKFFEFSGWQRGIDFIKSNNIFCDSFLFVNDMFLHDSFFDRCLVNQQALKSGLDLKAMIGRKMIFPVSGKLLGNEINSYMRTHIFLVPYQVIEELGSINSVDASLMERFFIPSYDPNIPLFRIEAPLSKSLQEFIFFYLTSKWNRKRPYTCQNFEILRSKAVSILNALLLSIRIQQLGYLLIPYSRVPLLSAGFIADARKEEVSFKKDKGFFQDPSIAPDRFWFKNMSFYHHLPNKVFESTMPFSGFKFSFKIPSYNLLSKRFRFKPFRPLSSYIRRFFSSVHL